MKKLIYILTVLILFTSSAFALSDAEYLKMKRNSPEFARADRKLTNTWNKLKKSLPDFVFAELQKDQREWIRKGRDNDAKEYIKDGNSRTEAYTLATYFRANQLPDIAKRIEESFDDVQTEPGFPLNEDDNKGEIEEERFNVSDSDTDIINHAGNYTRRDKNAFMTVLIINKNEMEAEVTISIKNPEATWSAKGWIGENNVLELFDANYSGCQANLTFNKNFVKIETSPEDDWDEILGESVRLDGTYDRN